MPPLRPSSSSSGDDSSTDDEQLNAPASQAHKKAKKEETSSESGGEEESSDNEEQERSIPVQTPSKPASESESGDSDSGSDSESEPAMLVTPLNSRPMERPTTNNNNNNNKSPNGKAHFQRVWSHDDEIKILKGLVEVMNKRGLTKWNKAALQELFSLVASSLSIEVTEYRLNDRIRRLKQKYMTLVKKWKDPKTATGQDRSVLDLAEKVWGNEAVKVHDAARGKPKKNKKKANGTAAMVKCGAAKSHGNGTIVRGEEESLKRKFPLWNDVVAMVGNSSALSALEKIDLEEVMIMERDLKKARVVDIKHCRHRLELLQKSLELVGEGVKSSIG